MSRSRFSLRQALAGVLFAGCMAFGSVQAFGTPPAKVGIPVTCNRFDSSSLEYCTAACQEAGYDYGSCAYTGYCDCRRLRPGAGG